MKLFIDCEFTNFNGEFQRAMANRQVTNGTHPFFGGELQRKRLKEGTHYFLNQPDVKCPHCNKVMKPGNFKRWHGDNCKKELENDNRG